MLDSCVKTVDQIYEIGSKIVYRPFGISIEGAFVTMKKTVLITGASSA